ncbi:MAG TPA: nucleotidyltransferase family protein [Chthoniobacterales bacterium]
MGAIILSAGASRRMGSPKALLPWGKSTVLQHLSDLWTSAGATQIAVVLDPANSAIAAELDRLAVSDRIPNPHATDGGMMSSLRAAAKWPNWNASIRRFAVALVDQPHISRGTLISLNRFSHENPKKICQPQFGNRRGHPVFLPKEIFVSLAATTEPDFRAFIRRHASLRAFLPCADEAVISDMDTPEDYRKAVERNVPDDETVGGL